MLKTRHTTGRNNAGGAPVPAVSAYLHITERRNRDGSTAAYCALAETVWNVDAKRPEARVVHIFGRADQVDRAALQRLVNGINRMLDAGEDIARGT